jgi:hypothetical protein
MKSLLVAITFMASMFGCHKDKTGNRFPEEKHVIGAWSYVEQYVSNGGPGVWNKVQPGGETIEFRADGSFRSSVEFLKGANRYEIIDSVQLKIAPIANSLGHVVMNFTFLNNNNELQLSPLLPARCIEGCASKFTRK